MQLGTAMMFATVGDGSTVRQPLVGHYDDVIVTVPIAALGRVSKQLAQRAKNRDEAVRPWKTMLRNLGTVATQSIQLWVNRIHAQLGWTHGQVSFSAFVHPFDTWADLSHWSRSKTSPTRVACTTSAACCPNEVTCAMGRVEPDRLITTGSAERAA